MEWYYYRIKPQGVLHLTFCKGGGGIACNGKRTQSDVRFSKNEWSKRSKNNEKGVNEIENQEENWYKIIQNGKMTDLDGKLDQV